jgi:putative SOS response-associated peptidase YedK
MCGRFSLTTPADALAEAFGLEEVPALETRWNIAPGQDVAVIGRRDTAHPPRLARLRWGFARDGGGLLINARSEGAERTPAFRDALRTRRCLLPADGFYEWKREGAAKQAFLARRRDGAPFALGGLWRPGQGPEQQPTCVILTVEPNELLRQVHERMPLIVPPAAWATWLDPAPASAASLRPLLRPYPADELHLTRVGPWVNDARHDDPRCWAES